MKKILVVFDQSYYAPSATEFAIRISKGQSNILFGVFIEELRYIDHLDPLLNEPDITGYPSQAQLEMIQREQMDLNENIKRFVKSCELAGTQYQIHEDEGTYANELVKESDFADLIIIDYDTYFSDHGLKGHDKPLSEVLSQTRCPVVIVPSEQQQVDNVILCYDGTPSSVYAIKQFTYLFPDWTADKDVSLVTVVENKDEEIDDVGLLLEYLAVHFPSVDLKRIIGDPASEILKIASDTPNSMLVMGSFGRSFLSRILKPSIANKILRAEIAATFITHA